MKLALTLFFAALSAQGAHAQSGTSGSESFVSAARNLPAAATRASSETVVAETAVAFPTAGARTTSESYAFRGGAVWSGGSLDPTWPVLFGVVDADGPAVGGESELVLGLGFQSPGAGATVATLGGAPAGGVAVLSDTQLSFSAPAGQNGFGNPLGRVDLTVQNALGTSTSEGAYVYTPALLTASTAQTGATATLRTVGEPGDLQGLYYGFSIPGAALPFPPIAGAWELLALFKSPLPAAFAGTGTTTWSLPIPDDAGLVGLDLEWQAFSLTSLFPLEGSFTNRVVTTIVD